MFKGSGQINPQGLKNDYSGYERAAAIKQQTLAGVGRAIKEGHEKIVKKKKDAAALESSKVLMAQVAKSAGFEIDPETLAAIAKGADPEFMNTATETMAKLGQFSQEKEALLEKQKKDRAVAQQLADQAGVSTTASAGYTNAQTDDLKGTSADKEAFRTAYEGSDTVTDFQGQYKGKDFLGATEGYIKMKNAERGMDDAQLSQKGRGVLTRLPSGADKIDARMHLAMNGITMTPDLQEAINSFPSAKGEIEIKTIVDDKGVSHKLLIDQNGNPQQVPATKPGKVAMFSQMVEDVRKKGVNISEEDETKLLRALLDSESGQASEDRMVANMELLVKLSNRGKTPAPDGAKPNPQQLPEGWQPIN